MARKKDPRNQENVDRPRSSQEGSGERDRHYKDEGVAHDSDTIKNASAAGLGAIGRNDQEQKGRNSDPTSNAANEY